MNNNSANTTTTTPTTITATTTPSHIPQESIEFQLSSKLQSPWSAEKIASQLNRETLETLLLPMMSPSSTSDDDNSSAAIRFSALETSVKVRLLMSSLSLRKNQQQQLKDPLKRVMKHANQDHDDWVKVISEILESYPAFASSHPTQQDMDSIAPVEHTAFRETVEHFEKMMIASSSDSQSPSTESNDTPNAAPTDKDGKAVPKIGSHIRGDSGGGLRSLIDMYMTYPKQQRDSGNEVMNVSERIQRPKHLLHHQQHQKQMEKSQRNLLQTNAHFKLRPTARDDLVEPMRFLDMKIQEYRTIASESAVATKGSSRMSPSPSTPTPASSKYGRIGRPSRPSAASASSSIPRASSQNRPPPLPPQLRARQTTRSVSLIDTDEMEQIMKVQEEARALRQQKQQQELEAEKLRKKQEKEEARQLREKERQERKRKREEEKKRKIEEAQMRKRQRSEERQQLLQQQMQQQQQQQQAMSSLTAQQQLLHQQQLQWRQQQQYLQQLSLSRLTPEQQQQHLRQLSLSRLTHEQQRQMLQATQQQQQQQQSQQAQIQQPQQQPQQQQQLGNQQNLFSTNIPFNSMFPQQPMQTYANMPQSLFAGKGSSPLGQFKFPFNPQQVFANAGKKDAASPLTNTVGGAPFSSSSTTSPSTTQQTLPSQSGTSTMLSLLGENPQNDPFARSVSMPGVTSTAQTSSIQQTAAQLLQGCNRATSETQSRIISFLSGVGQPSVPGQSEEELLIHEDIDANTGQRYRINFHMDHQNGTNE